MGDTRLPTDLIGLRDGLALLINAWVAHSPGAPLVWESLHLDDLAPGEVLVRIGAAGICHTDEIYVDGSRPSPFPVVVGHEAAGVVADVGVGVTGIEIGARVALSFSSCGSCRSCQLGRPSYCVNFRALNSGFGGTRSGAAYLSTMGDAPVTGGFFGQSSFASHVITSPRNVIPIADSVPFHIAAPLGCGVQTGAGAVLNTLKIRPGESLIVFGVGGVGISAVMAAVVAGASRIVVVDPQESRRALALSVGATGAFPPDAGELLPGGFDYAIDTSGRPDSIRAALAATHNTGAVALIASGPAGTDISLPLRDLIVGRSIRGLVEGDSMPQLFIPELLDLWRAGRFPVDALITTFAHTELNEAMRAMHEGAVTKAVIVFPERD